MPTRPNVGSLIASERRTGLSGSAGALILVALVGVGSVVAIAFETYWPRSVTTTQTVTFTQTPSLGTGGLYITSVAFSGSNITVTLGNSGGGVPTPPGYGDTGVTARYVAAIIISSGPKYYHYDWNCQLNTPCALAPGPYRYFTLTGTTSSLNKPWNLGNSSLVPDILSVRGELSAVMTFPWQAGGTYTIYLQSNDNSIVYQQTVTAPA
jgi:hypothetical protein